MARRWPSLAERFRANRAAFTLALELGCTPAEAEAELARRAALARVKEFDRRMAAIDAAIAASRSRHTLPPQPSTEPAIRRWWID